MHGILFRGKPSFDSNELPMASLADPAPHRAKDVGRTVTSPEFCLGKLVPHFIDGLVRLDEHSIIRFVKVINVRPLC
jgi:hypothetical protein